MTSTSKPGSLQPSLIIDIGTENVKFTQPILNTFSISQLLRNGDNFIDKNNKKEEAKNLSFQLIDQAEENQNFINPNTIFDISEFCHSFPTILSNFSKESYPSSLFFRKNRTNDFNNHLSKVLQDAKNLPASLSNTIQSNKINPFSDFFNEKFNANKNLKYESDVIFNGEIQNFSGWRNIIERIGEFGYNKHRFAEEQFSNTPLILTQAALNPEILFSQNEKILEILFEEYKCPQLLICSQALVNLLSFSQTSGTVVDLGESGTQITTVVDGFTQYNDSFYSSFLSGRNFNLIYYFEKMKQQQMRNFGFNDFNENNVTNNNNNICGNANSYGNGNGKEFFSVGYSDYFAAKSQRENLANLAFYQKYFGNMQGEDLNKNLAKILFGDENYNSSNNIKKNFYASDKNNNSKFNINNDVEENYENENENNNNENDENKIDDRIKLLYETEFRCYDGFYFYPKFFRNLFNIDNNPSKYFEAEKPNESMLSMDKEPAAAKVPKKEFLLEALSMYNDSSPELYQNLRALLHFSVGGLFPNLEIDKNVDIKNDPPQIPRIGRMKEKLQSVRADKIEEELFIKPCSFMKKSNDVKIFQMSINSLVLTNMENLIFRNMHNAELYRNVYFCGGVLNSLNFTSCINENFKQMVSVEDKDEIHYNFSSSKINDNIYSFYKGANFLSKLDSLNSIMISRLDYYEKGKDKLCFNFI